MGKNYSGSLKVLKGQGLSGDKKKLCRERALKFIKVQRAEPLALLDIRTRRLLMTYGFKNFGTIRRRIRKKKQRALINHKAEGISTENFSKWGQVKFSKPDSYFELLFKMSFKSLSFRLRSFSINNFKKGIYRDYWMLSYSSLPYLKHKND